jgi:hypothetical protein
MAGGGIVVFILLSLSMLILMVWFVKGSGKNQQKIKLIAYYFSFTLLPGVLLIFVSEKFDLDTWVSNLSFLLLAISVLSGFIIPMIANRTFRGRNEHRI